MTKFTILTPAAASFTTGGGGYDHELEALEGMGAEIVECAPTEDAFVAAAPSADAVYAKGMKFTARMIGALPKCRIIALGSVGVDYVDVAAATAKGIPVTNCPDTFIDEVADHAMMLLLAAHRRCIEQDRMVREGRWGEGRPQLLKIPRLIGLTLGFVSFGRVARATARRAAAFGLRLKAFDPFVEETRMSELGVGLRAASTRQNAGSPPKAESTEAAWFAGDGGTNCPGRTTPALRTLPLDSITVCSASQCTAAVCAHTDPAKPSAKHANRVDRSRMGNLDIRNRFAVTTTER